MDYTPILFDPTDSTTLYVGTEGSGVFKSTNGGLTWLEFNPGFDTSDADVYIRDLLFQRTDPLALYAGSDDGVFLFQTTPSSEECSEIFLPLILKSQG